MRLDAGLDCTETSHNPRMTYVAGNITFMHELVLVRVSLLAEYRVFVRFKNYV